MERNSINASAFVSILFMNTLMYSYVKIFLYTILGEICLNLVINICDVICENASYGEVHMNKQKHFLTKLCKLLCLILNRIRLLSNLRKTVKFTDLAHQTCTSCITNTIYSNQKHAKPSEFILAFDL